MITLLSWDCYNGYLHIAISDTDDPTGSRTIATITDPGALPDFPGLGLSDDKLVVGINEYAIDSGSCGAVDYAGTSYVALDIADFLDGSPVSYLSMVPSTDLWDIRPAMNESSAADLQLVYTDSYTGDIGHAVASGSVVDYPSGADPFAVDDAGIQADLSLIGILAPPLQPGGLLNIDGRVTSAVWRDGRLVFVSTYPCGDGGLYDCARVSELSTVHGTTTQDFLIGDPGDGYDTFMPGAAIDGNGVLYVVGAQSRFDTPVWIWAMDQCPSRPC